MTLGAFGTPLVQHIPKGLLKIDENPRENKENPNCPRELIPSLYPRYPKFLSVRVLRRGACVPAFVPAFFPSCARTAHPRTSVLNLGRLPQKSYWMPPSKKLGVEVRCRRTHLLWCAVLVLQREHLYLLY